MQGLSTRRRRLTDSGAFPRLREPAVTSAKKAPPLAARFWRPVVLSIALLGLVAGALVTRWAHVVRAERADAAADGLASARARAIEAEVAALVEGLHALGSLLEVRSPTADASLETWSREVAARHPSFDGVVWQRAPDEGANAAMSPTGRLRPDMASRATEVVATARGMPGTLGLCSLHVSDAPANAGGTARDAWIVLVRPPPANDAFALRLVLSRMMERLATSEDPSLALALLDDAGAADLARVGDVADADVVGHASVAAIGHRFTLAAGGSLGDVLPQRGVSPWLLGALAMLLWEVVNAGLVALATGWRGHALERQARVVHRVLHALRESVILTDRGGKIVLANAEARRMLGVGEDGLLDERHLGALLVSPTEKSPAAVRGALLADALAGRSIDVPARRLALAGAADGAWIESLVCPVVGTRGIDGALVVSRDVTARLEAADVSRRMHERDAEMAVAQRVQRRLYPRACPAVPGLLLAGTVVPAAATCGDYYDVLVRPDGSVLIAIGDVSGHGFGPAIVMAEVRTMVRAMADAALDPVEILRHVDAVLAHEHDGELFVTLLLVTIAPWSREVAYVNAGHVPAQHIDARGQVVARMPATGPPLGIGETRSHRLVPSRPLESGDILIAVTDGATESPGPDDEPFDDSGVVEVVRTHQDASPSAIATAVTDAVFAYSRGRSARDDVTVVVAKAVSG